MVLVTPWYPDKQVVLKFYGTLSQPELTVELQILQGCDRNQTLITLPVMLPILAGLKSTAETHWHKQYRSYLTKSRAIKILEVEIEPAVTWRTCHQSRQKLENQLNAWLETPAFQPIRDALLLHLSPQDHIQVLIHSDDLTLRQLPWVSWQLFKNYPKVVMVQSSLGAMHLPVEKSSPARSRLRILGIFGSNDGIDTEMDKQLLQTLPKALVEVQILDQPDRAEINDQLWEQPWDMIVFAGHGNTTPDGQGVLYLNNRDETLSLNHIWLGLRKAVHSGLQVAIFNACAGLGLLARNLQDDLCIPQMIVMRDVVPDPVAQKFLQCLLAAFAQGESIAVAASLARDRLQGLEHLYPCASWLPVIWQNPHAMPLRLPRADVETHPEPTLQPEPSPQRLLKLVGGVLVSAILLWGVRSPAANWLYNQGVKADEQKNAWLAKENFYVAAILKRDEPYSRFMLGRLHEDEGDFETALHWHGEARELGLPEAMAAYVRLHLWTTQSTNLSSADYAALRTYTKNCLDMTEYDGVRASCLKNQGWLDITQQRWTDAVTSLEQAIALNDDSPHAHCLLAQALEQLGETERAQTHWRKTQILSEAHIPEQDHCSHLADKQPP